MDYNKRNTLKYSFKNFKLDDLRKLGALVEDQGGFKDKYGRLLSLLRIQVKDGLLSTLLQFYDPDYHCFTFPDYQLLPTLEEYSQLVGLPIMDKSPFPFLEKDPKEEDIAKAICLKVSDIKGNMIAKGGTVGLPTHFLIKKAQYYADHLSMPTFETILVLLIYGMLLFPSFEGFVDINAIKIFMKNNPVPTLLGNTYHSIHLRNFHGGGMITCCVPLLYKWFISHLPKSFLSLDKGFWSPRVMALTHSDIVWYDRVYDGILIIDSWGDFANVPLLGFNGGINYNPVLARRQLGYPLKEPPKSVHVEKIFFKGDKELQDQIVSAWRHLHKKGKESLGKPNCVSMEPYLRWVRERAIKLKMPYPRQDPLPPRREPVLVFMSEAEKLEIALKRAQHEAETWKNKYQVIVSENEELQKQLQAKNEEVRSYKKRRIYEDLFSSDSPPTR